MKKVTIKNEEVELVYILEDHLKIRHLEYYWKEVAEVTVEETPIRGTMKIDAYVIFTDKEQELIEIEDDEIEDDDRTYGEIVTIYAYSFEDAKNRLESMFENIIIKGLVDRTPPMLFPKDVLK